MKTSPKDLYALGVPGSGKPFFQPLMVAGVGFALIFLVFVIGMMDLNSMDKTLTRHMENSGREMIRHVQQVASYYFDTLGKIPQPRFGSELGRTLRNDAFSLQESLILDLVSLSRDIDLEISEGTMQDKQLTDLAAQEGLWLIAVLDQRGSVRYKTRRLPRHAISLARPVFQGQAEIALDILNVPGSKREKGFVILRTHSFRGAVVLGLDRAGLIQRRVKISIQKAVEEAGQLPESAYFLVTDQNNRVVGQSGEFPEDVRNVVENETSAESPGDVISRKRVVGDEKLLEITTPFSIGTDFFGTGRVVLHRWGAEKILKKEQRRVLFSIAFVAVITLLSMYLIHMNQKRHLVKMQEMERRLSQAERLSAMGRLAAGVAHEIRNPLNAISMAVQRLGRFNSKGPSGEGEKGDDLTQVIREEIRRLNLIIEEFVGFSHGRNMTFMSHDVMALLKQIILLVEDEAEAQGIEIRTAWQHASLFISMDDDKLKQAFLNIFKNAMESMPQKGLITVRADAPDKTGVIVRISDTGTGMSPEEVKKIFEPDYTTKEKGLGLGLPLVFEIIRGHGGSIQVQSAVGEGTTFEIFLPAAQRARS